MDARMQGFHKTPQQPPPPRDSVEIPRPPRMESLLTCELGRASSFGSVGSLGVLQEAIMGEAALGADFEADEPRLLGGGSDDGGALLGGRVVIAEVACSGPVKAGLASDAGLAQVVDAAVESGRAEGTQGNAAEVAEAVCAADQEAVGAEVDAGAAEGAEDSQPRGRGGPMPATRQFALQRYVYKWNQRQLRSHTLSTGCRRSCVCTSSAFPPW